MLIHHNLTPQPSHLSVASFRLRLQGDVINENEQGHDRHDTRRHVNGLKNENENANECMRSHHINHTHYRRGVNRQRDELA